MTNEYYSVVEKAIKHYEDIYAEISRQMSQVDDPELDTRDWSGILSGVQSAINALKVMAEIHKFDRISKAQAQVLLLAYQSGISGGKIIVPISHTITGFDTLRSLEQTYGIGFQEILNYNGMLSTEFVTGRVISIPYATELNRGSTDIFVLGDQSGENILGTDLNNSMDALSGDFQVLVPRESFKQAIDNVIATERGGLPFYESYGADIVIGEDFPSEAAEPMVQLRVAAAITADPRVQELGILKVARDTENQTRTNISVEIKPLQGRSLIITKGI